MASSAFSRPLPEGFQYLVTPTAEINTLVCYIRTVDGMTLNLNSLCGKVPGNSPLLPSNPTDYQNSASPLSDSLNQSCRSEDGCVRLLQPDNLPQPLYAPKDGSLSG